MTKCRGSLGVSFCVSFNMTDLECMGTYKEIKVFVLVFTFYFDLVTLYNFTTSLELRLLVGHSQGLTSPLDSYSPHPLHCMFVTTYQINDTMA